MTDIGYDYILEKIREHTVEPPDDFNIEQLHSWILGYSNCMTEIIKIIGDLKNTDAYNGVRFSNANRDYLNVDPASKE